jgi:hypothetical protein
MVGAGVAAAYAGWIRQGTGDYFWAWMTAGGLCVLAAGMCLSIPFVRDPDATGPEAVDPDPEAPGTGSDTRRGGEPTATSPETAQI